MSLWRRYAQAVFSVDLRSLALFRIALGVLVAVDALIRLQDVEIFLSDDGAKPRITDLAATMWVRPSLLHLITDTWWQTLLLVVTLVAGLVLAAGWRSRVISVVVWVLVLSVQNRNNYVNTGADSVLLTACLFACFLPVSARFSVDARRTPQVADPLWCSVAAGGFVLQVVILYVFNVLNKSGRTWMNGTAVLQALHIDQHSTVVGLWLRDTLPELSPLLTYGTLLVEFSTILLLLPRATGVVRTLLVVLLWGLHGGLAVCMNLGLFSPACMVLWLAFLPAAVWQLRPFAAFERKFAAPTTTETAPTTKAQTWQTRAAGVLVAVVVVTQLVLNVAKYQERPPPPWMQHYARALGIDQLWRLFAFNPSRHDGWFVVVGHQQGGRDVSLYPVEGAAVSWERPALISALNKNSRWRKFMMNMGAVEERGARRRYAGWLCRHWNASHGGDDALVGVDLTYMQEITRRDFKPPKKRDRETQDMGRFACTADGAREIRQPKKKATTTTTELQPTTPTTPMTKEETEEPVPQE